MSKNWKEKQVIIIKINILILQNYNLLPSTIFVQMSFFLAVLRISFMRVLLIYFVVLVVLRNKE